MTNISRHLIKAIYNLWIKLNFDTEQLPDILLFCNKLSVWVSVMRFMSWIWRVKYVLELNRWQQYILHHSTNFHRAVECSWSLIWLKTWRTKDTTIDCTELRFGLMSKNINTFKSKFFRTEILKFEMESHSMKIIFI